MIFLQIEIPQLAGMLKYGVPGLCAIAFILCYLLLFREGSRNNPRPEMMRSIRQFMWLTGILGVASAVVSLRNPTKPSTDDYQYEKPRKTPSKSNKTGNKSNSLTDRGSSKPVSSSRIKIEIFYVQDPNGVSKGIASGLADGLEDNYDVAVTALTDQRKKSLKVSISQIRHEASELGDASKLKAKAEKILQYDEVSFSMKQITSSSPQYLSVFICEK